ncbi:MAG: hypothetical protein A3K09_06555 [Nitrospinae bacterium RIFCSPLOWO2_12_FULL_47_7]|nr:MAG: hypothetical protein A3K09_06555 [Nitrospinae bacterium RIFCSPLOWO2_12_FULL_47_7]
MPQKKIFQKGDIIFQEGSASDSIYVIEHGEVEISHLKSNGDKHIIGILGTNDILGEMGLIADLPRSATATAVSDCKISIIQKKHFNEIISQHPEILKPLLTMLAQRMRETLTLLKTGYKLPGKEKRKRLS